MSWQSLLATLLACDNQNSVLLSHQKAKRAYDAFGGELRRSEGLGYNGILLEAMPSGYLLGNGYRLYTPTLRRFNSPDSLGPFGQGGFNCYVYCGGDPVNFVDPGGRSRLSKWFRLVFGRATSTRPKKGAPISLRATIARDSLTLSASVKPAAGLSIVNAYGVGPASVEELAASRQFLGVAQAIGDKSTWSGIRSHLRAQETVFGRFDAGREGWTIYNPIRDVTERRFRTLFPAYDYASGFKGLSATGGFVSDDVFARRVLHDARGQLYGVGLSVIIRRNATQKKPAIPGRLFIKHRS
jgi:RHS repeat-associated protein